MINPPANFEKWSLAMKNGEQSMNNEGLPGDAPDRTLMQLYLAEYQALTTRASYWIVLQFSLLPAVPVYIVLGYQASSSIKTKEIVIWATLAVLHLLAILWANTMLEQFSIVKYIECYLRPQIRKGLATDRFWIYEPYLIKHRPIKPKWGNYSIPALGLIVLAIIIAVRFPEFSRWDAVGAIINLGMLGILWNFSYKISKIQREWSEHDKPLVQKLEEEE